MSYPSKAPLIASLGITHFSNCQMTQVTDEPAKSTVRTRHPIIFWTWSAVTCVVLWQFASSGLKVAFAERQAETGQLADYKGYMLNSFVHGIYFVEADHKLLIWCYMVGPVPWLKSYLALTPLALLIRTSLAFYAVWQFYRCQRDMIMDDAATMCMASNIPSVNVSYAGLFSFNVTCAKEYAYTADHITAFAGLATGAWILAVIWAGTLLRMIMVAFIREPARLNDDEEYELSHRESQEQLDDKM